MYVGITVLWQYLVLAVSTGTLIFYNLKENILNVVICMYLLCGCKLWSKNWSSKFTFNRILSDVLSVLRWTWSDLVFYHHIHYKVLLYSLEWRINFEYWSEAFLVVKLWENVAIPSLGKKVNICQSSLHIHQPFNATAICQTFVRNYNLRT